MTAMSGDFPAQRPQHNREYQNHTTNLPQQEFRLHSSPTQSHQRHSELHRFTSVSPGRDTSSVQARRSDTNVHTHRKVRNSEINPEWGLTKAGKKRQRLPLACQFCRKKKTRCSGEQPICKLCLRLSLPCVYRAGSTRKPKNSLKKDNSVSGSENRDSNLNSLKGRPASSSPHSNQNSTTPGRSEGTRHLLFSTSLSTSLSSNLPYEPFDRQEVLPPPAFLHPSSLPPRPSPSESQSATGLPSINSLSTAYQRTYSHSLPALQNGVTNSLTTRQNLPPIREPYLVRPPSSSSSVFTPTTSIRSPKHEARTPLPSHDVLLKLVEIYFARVSNQTCGFLHRLKFLREIEEGKVSDGLLYSICAISARFLPAPTPVTLGQQSPAGRKSPSYPAGEPYAVEARRLALCEFGNPTVENVQMSLLLALHDFGIKKGQSAWMFAGMAIRMASALKLNMEVVGDPTALDHSNGLDSIYSSSGDVPRPFSRGKDNWIEREVRRRTFWACFLLERLDSTGIARLPIIQEVDCLVQLPAADRCFVSGLPVKTEQLHQLRISSAADARSHPHTQNMGAEAYLVRIVALWGRIKNYVYQGRQLNYECHPSKPDSGFTELALALDEWRNGLPSGELKYSPSNLANQVPTSQVSNFVLMHVAYHTAVCTLHRFSVPTCSQANQQNKDSESGLPVWNSPQEPFLLERVKTCFEHAKAISTIMAEVISRSDCIVTAPFLGFALFTANLFHLHQAFTPCPYVDETPEQARKLFEIGVIILNDLRMWWRPLETLYKAIRIFWKVKADKSPSPPLEQATNKETGKVTVADRHAIGRHGQQRLVGCGSEPLPKRISQPTSPGHTEHFDLTGLIPLPGGNFGLDFIDPSIRSLFDGESFEDLISDRQTEKLGSEPHHMWRDTSPAPSGRNIVDAKIFSPIGDHGRSLIHPTFISGLPISPFSWALHGFAQPPERKGTPISSKIVVKDEHQSSVEGIREENSARPLGNSTIGGRTTSTANANPTPGLSTERALPCPVALQRADEVEDGSAEEAAADLLVYFHSRSGASESTVIDSVEISRDELRGHPVVKGSSSAALSSSPRGPPTGDVLRKRKRHEFDESTIHTYWCNSKEFGPISFKN